jgi:hypothetical protein
MPAYLDKADWGPGGPPAMTQRYTAMFDVGPSRSDGCYSINFKMKKGKSWTLYVGSPTADACTGGKKKPGTVYLYR